MKPMLLGWPGLARTILRMKPMLFYWFLIMLKEKQCETNDFSLGPKQNHCKTNAFSLAKQNHCNTHAFRLTLSKTTAKPMLFRWTLSKTNVKQLLLFRP